MLGQRARSGVSRETRLLLLTGFISLAWLWVLARIRFPESRTSAPVLAQLTKTSTFDDLPLQIYQAEVMNRQMPGDARRSIGSEDPGRVSLSCRTHSVT
jgi:hypothetical protein